MPPDYEILKKHISVAHPEILDSFVEGWNNLGPSGKDFWTTKTILNPREKVESFPWLSWTTMKIRELRDSREGTYFLDELSTYEKRLAVLFHNRMEHSGSIFSFPYMPPLRDRVYYITNSSSESRTERHSIAKDAAKIIIHAELRKVLMKWQEDLDEHGIDALRKVYFANPLTDDQKKFDLSDADLEIDCDSASEFSDVE